MLSSCKTGVVHLLYQGQASVVRRSKNLNSCVYGADDWTKEDGYA